MSREIRDMNEVALTGERRDRKLMHRVIKQAIADEGASRIGDSRGQPLILKVAHQWR